MITYLKRFIVRIFIISFLSIIFICSIFNFRNVLLKKDEIKSLYQQVGYSKELFAGLDDLYRINTTKKEVWIDFYGLIQKVLQREIIGNLEFAKNKAGLMEIVSVNEIETAADFADNLIKLNQICKDKEREFLYIQMPLRNDGSVPNDFANLDDYYMTINDNIRNEDIWCLDGKQILDQSGMELNDFYMKTDLHPTTEGEIAVANQLVDALATKEIEIKRIISGSEDSDYIKQKQELLGNLAKSVGKYYNGEDIFNQYIPKNDSETIYEITDLTTNNLVKAGTFSETLMNGFDSIVESNPYWVVNYLQYGKYVYNIKNHKSQGPNLLFICDSFCFRTISYLSFGCENITIIDPRFKDVPETIDYFINQGNYDAVICLHGSEINLPLS